ncbi:MAG: FecR domain-containing protein [Lutibacter sp.]|nr:FecR domain-containing protein [Lutibacter sp.]
MKKEEVDKQDFQALIEKYLDGKTTLEELKLLVNYYESYQHEHAWVEALGNEDAVRNRMLINILEELENSEKTVKVIPIYKKPLFKYAVAASLIAFVSLTFFFKNEDTNEAEIKVVDTIIKPVIEIGTDKATLTLGDGSQIALEKGTSFQRQNTTSNGEEIVYESGKSKSDIIEYNYLTIPRGGQFSIKLSDGTQVWLNSESKLKYPVKFVEGKLRKVELVYGEAYFAVSPSSAHKGAKFMVFNDSQEIEVIGTEFNVKAYKDESNVYTTLVEGKVAISIEDRKQHLVPGQQLYLDKTSKTLLIKSVDVYNETAWKDGVFSFENKTLKEMMEVLSRWYDVEVIIENKSIENEEFVGVLRKNQNLKEILTNIKNFGIIKNFEIHDKKVVLQ